MSTPPKNGRRGLRSLNEAVRVFARQVRRENAGIAFPPAVVRQRAGWARRFSEIIDRTSSISHGRDDDFED